MLSLQKKIQCLRKVKQSMFFFASFCRAESIALNNSIINGVFTMADTPIFVEVWSPWCGHCQNFKEHWDHISESDKYKGKILFATANCGQKSKMCNKFPGIATPRFFWFDNGSAPATPFTGSPTKDGVEDFLDHQLNGALVEVDSDTEDMEIKHNCSNIRGQQCFVFTIPKNDPNSFNIARKASDEVKSFPITLYIREGENDKPKLKVLETIDDELEGDFTVENIKEYISYKSLSYLSRYSRMSSYYSQVHEIPILVFVQTLDSYVNSSSLDEVAPLAYKHFSTLHTTCSMSPELCNYVWEKADNKGFVTILNRSERYFWVLREPYTKEEFVEWTNSVYEHKIKPYGPGPSFMGKIISFYYRVREIGGYLFVIIHFPIVSFIILLALILYIVCNELYMSIRLYNMKRRYMKRQKDKEE